MITEKRTIPKITKKFRKKLNLSQKEIIEKANLEIDANTLSKYENGYTDPPASVLLLLADYYDCSIDALLSRSYLNPIANTANFTRSDYKIQNGIGKQVISLDQEHYAFDKGIDAKNWNFRNFYLLQDDPNIYFPKHTRLIVQMVDDGIKIDRIKERIYLVKDVVPDESGKNLVSTFFTKASMVKDTHDEPHNSNVIYYTYKGQIKFHTLTHFKEIIEGLVVKVFLDSLVK